MALHNCLRFHLPQFCGLDALGQLCSTARGWVWQTKMAIAKAVVLTKVDVDLLCTKHRQEFPATRRVDFLVLRNNNRDLMDRGVWTEVCRLQVCLSRIRKMVNSSTIIPRGTLTMGDIVAYIIPGMVGNFCIDEYALLHFYNEATPRHHDIIDPSLLDEECVDAIANFSQTWSRSCVFDEFTVGQVLWVLFRSKIDLAFQRFISGSDN